MRYWRKHLVACVNGGDNRSKGTVASLGMTLFVLLPSGKKQLAEKAVNGGEIVLDPSDPSSSPNQCEAIEDIIATVDKGSATDTIRRM